MYSDVELSLRYIVEWEMHITEQYVAYAIHCVKNICVGMQLYVEGYGKSGCPVVPGDRGRRRACFLLHVFLCLLKFVSYI